MIQRHFVDVWNPSYASNSMEAHLAILLGAVKHFDLGQLESDDEIYVWWGKVRSPNRRHSCITRRSINLKSEASCRS